MTIAYISLIIATIVHVFVSRFTLTLEDARLLKCIFGLIAFGICMITLGLQKLSSIHIMIIFVWATVVFLLGCECLSRIEKEKEDTNMKGDLTC